MNHSIIFWFLTYNYNHVLFNMDSSIIQHNYKLLSCPVRYNILLPSVGGVLSIDQ